MNNAKQTDLAELLSAQNPIPLQRNVAHYVNTLRKTWLSPDHDALNPLLQSYAQQLQRAQRALPDKGEEICAYSLGMLAGAVDLISTLYRAEQQDADISRLRNKGSLEILQALSSRSMYHGELADALGKSYSALSNIMKTVLRSGAVQAARSGRHTYYSLTPAGHRFIQKQRNDISVQCGDTVHILSNENSSRLDGSVDRIFSIMNGEKYLSLKNEEEALPFSAVKSSQDDLRSFISQEVAHAAK